MGLASGEVTQTDFKGFSLKNGTPTALFCGEVFDLFPGEWWGYTLSWCVGQLNVFLSWFFIAHCK